MGKWDNTYNTISNGEPCPNCGSSWTEDSQYLYRRRYGVGPVKIPIKPWKKKDGIFCSNCKYLGEK